MNRSYFEQTQQLWKLWVTGMLALAGFACFLMMGGDIGDELLLILGTLGVALSFLTLVWLALSIRCRSCRTLLAWRAINEERFQTWLPALLRYDRCPVCDDGAGTDLE
jgi:hypothetical protein